MQHNVTVTLKPRRGMILDAQNRVLALDTPASSVYAISRAVKDKEVTAGQLEKLLRLDKKFLISRLKKDKSFVWIKRKITEDEKVSLIEADIKGIALIPETRRVYPSGELFCHVLGFTDIDNNGIEGLEAYYDEYLKGRKGWENFYRDARNKLISAGEEHLPVREGYGLVLSADEVIQHICEREIQEIVAKYRPESVMIIAMSPHTGAILAMANYPKFDLNDYRQSESGVIKNRCLTDTFEPGSVFKIVTASAVIEEGVVSTEDKFYCEKGKFRIGGRVLHDHKPYETLTFREIIEKSSNIGIVKAAERLGKDKLYAYIKKFGFGSKTGIDFSGEQGGLLRDKDRWSHVDMTTIPMGQGISCTAMQLANAVSVIANGGVVLRPRLVKKIIDQNGHTIKEFKREEIRRVISPETSLKLRELMLGVVERGTGKKAKIRGYKVCGKTGTAQKAVKGKGYKKGSYISSFIGFAPFKKPAISLVICINEPKGKYYGGSVAAPAFKNIMKKLLKYMEIPKT